MHRKYVRYLWVFALALLVPSLARQARASGAALELAPKDALGVLHADVEKLRKTQLFKDIEKEIREDVEGKKTLAKLRADAGIDPFKDITGVTVVFGPNMIKQSRDVLAIVEGTYNQAKVLKFIEQAEHEAPVAKTGPNGAYYLADHGSIAVAFRGKRVLLGAPQLVERALGKADGKAVLAAVRAPVENDMLWFAAAANGEARSRLGMLGSDTLETLAVGFSAPAGAKLHVHAHFSDPAQAAALAKELTDALARSQKDPMLTQFGVEMLLKKVLVVAKNGDLDIAAELTKKELEGVQKVVTPLIH